MNYRSITDKRLMIWLLKMLLLEII